MLLVALSLFFIRFDGDDEEETAVGAGAIGVDDVGHRVNIAVGDDAGCVAVIISGEYDADVGR